MDNGETAPAVTDGLQAEAARAPIRQPTLPNRPRLPNGSSWLQSKVLCVVVVLAGLQFWVLSGVIAHRLLTNVVRLHWDARLPQAAKQGRLDEVRRLLRSGVAADTHPYDSTFTPLMLAAGSGHFQVVQELVRAGADVSRLDGFKTNALFSTIAGRPERYQIARLLLERGSDVNCQETAFRRTPLIKAASRGDVPMLRLLLRWGARCDLRDRKGRTALDVARQYRHPEAARFLEQACAAPPARSRAP